MRFLAQYKLFILILVGFIGAAAVFVVQDLPVSLYPNSTKPSIRVTVTYDFEVQEFKENIGKKLEQSLRNIEGTDKVEAFYAPNSTRFITTFDWGVSSITAYQDVSTVASFYQNQLPQNNPPIRISYYDAGLELYIAVRPKSGDVEELSALLEKRLEPRLTNIRGISSVYISRINDKEASVRLNPFKLAAMDISVNDVLVALEEARFNFRLGTIQGTKNKPERQVIYVHKPLALAELKEITVGQERERIIRLSDVADISLRVKPQDRSFFIDEERVIAVAAWPLPDTNIYDIATRFEAAVSEELAGIADVVTINSPINYIEQSLRQMVGAVLLGMVFAGISVLLAFRSFRLGTLVLLAMPASVAVAVSLLGIFGIGINIISIGAIGIAIGMVIDGTVYVVDKISANLTDYQGLSAQEKSERVTAAVRNAAASVVSTTITSVVVFFPLILTQPIVKALVGDFVIIVILLLLASLLISLFFIPAVILILLSLPGKAKWLVASPKQKAPTDRSVLGWLLRQLLGRVWLKLPFIAGVGYLLYFALTIMATEVRREVIAQPLPNIIDVGIQFKSTDLSFALRKSLVEPIREAIVARYSEQIRFIFTDLRDNVGYISLHLQPDVVVDELITDLRGLVGETVHYTADVSPWVSASLKVEDIPDARVYVTSDDDQEAVQLLETVRTHLNGDKHVARLRAYPSTRQTDYVYLDFLDDRAAALVEDRELTRLQQDLADLAAFAVKPERLYDMNLSVGETPLSLQVGRERIQDADELAFLPIRIGNNMFNLGQLAEIRSDRQYSNFYSRNTSDTFLIEIWTQPDITHPIAYVQSLVDAIAGVDQRKVNVVGTGDEVERNIRSLKLALYTALALVLLVLLLDFVRIPLVLIAFVSVPLSIIGASLALYYFDSTLSINSLIGGIMLAGLGINNSIFIIHGYRGLSLSYPQASELELVVLAVRSRFRSVMITSVSTIFGMLPLALGLGNSGPIIQPLGLVMCGGMLSVLIFSLTVTPLLLYQYEAFRARRHQRSLRLSA